MHRNGHVRSASIWSDPLVWVLSVPLALLVLWVGPFAFSPPSARAVEPVQGPAQSFLCDPAYPTVCIPPGPPDLECHHIKFRDFAVWAPDPHGLDADGDGIGCEDIRGKAPLMPTSTPYFVPDG